jgi:4'-phosphopantetheinyl transferase
MQQRWADPGGHRWLALGEDALPAGEQWLAPGEAASLAGLRYTKRRTEYLLRRLVTKHAVASVTGRPTDPAALAGIEVRNAPSGAPYVCVDGAPLGLGVSITDRAGWAVCVTCPTAPPAGDPSEPPAVGCDLELVEPRTPGFVRDFLTAAEQRLVASRPAGDERDAAANLIWSAKESALKVLRIGLRRDTRTLEVTLTAPRGDGWGALTVRAVEGKVFPGWWRRDGRFLLTVAAEAAGPPPVAIGDPGVLAPAAPRHSWLDRPLYR